MSFTYNASRTQCHGELNHNLNMAEWSASPDTRWDGETQKVVGSNPGVTRSDGQ